MKKIVILLMALNLSACVNGYSKFYTAVPGATPDVIAKLRIATPPEVPLVEHSATFSDIEQRFGRLGYSPIGYSSFNSGSKESDKDAIEQGKNIGADLVVIINPSYTGTTTSQVPITTPTASTSYSSGSATAYGAGGAVTAYGNSTTTTYGTNTTYVPMTTNRYDYGAAYLVKRSYIFGVQWRDLTNDERAKLLSNSGVSVTLVINDTPAFRNDVLAGDIIVKIDGQRIYGEKEASGVLAVKRGKAVNFTIFRNGEVLEKTIKLAE